MIVIDCPVNPTAVGRVTIVFPVAVFIFAILFHPARVVDAVIVCTATVDPPPEPDPPTTRHRAAVASYCTRTVASAARTKSAPVPVMILLFCEDVRAWLNNVNELVEDAFMIVISRPSA